MSAHRRPKPPRNPTLEREIKAADEKLDLVHCDRPLTDRERRCALLTLCRLGEEGVRLVPSRGHCFYKGFLRGFALEMRPESVVAPCVFPTHTMYSGLMVYPLRSGAQSDRLAGGREIPVGYFGQEQVRAQIMSAFATTEHLGDDPAAFVGVYQQIVQGEEDVRVEYYAVAQCNSDATGQALYADLCAAQENDVSLVEFFTAKRVQSCLEKQRRHRARCILRLIKACGLGPVLAETNSMSAMVQQIVSSPGTVDVFHNTIETLENGNFVLLSDMRSLRAITSSGTAIRERGKLGIALLRGPFDHNRPGSDAAFIGYPTYVGPQFRESFTPSSTTKRCAKVTWHGASVDHFALSSESCDKRTEEAWRKYEEQCGVGSERRVLLQPAQVVMSAVRE